MAKIVNLQGVARGDELVATALTLNPNVLGRLTDEDIEMVNDDKESRVVGVRFPVKLLGWLDDYSREKAYKQGQRVTRNMVIIEMLELAQRSVEAASEKTETAPTRPKP